MPTYNRAEFLPRSIKSVLRQSFSQWELIVWDDGSTDNTKEIIMSYDDSRIRYFYDQNRGIAYARNRAIEEARGKYLAFLDSDDEWFLNKLITQTQIMESNPDIDFLFSNFININLQKKEKQLGFDQNALAMALISAEEIVPGLWKIVGGWLESLAVDDYVATDTIIMKKEVFKRLGGYNETLRSSVDYELKWRLGFSNINIAFIDDVLLTRYKPVGSLSSLSLVSVENHILVLNLCSALSISEDRNDLLPYLNQRFRNAYQHKIMVYGALNKKLMAFEAFLQSLKYGFRLGSFKLLIKALL